MELELELELGLEVGGSEHFTVGCDVPLSGSWILRFPDSGARVVL